MDALQQTIAGSAISNFIFLCIVGVGAFIKSRLDSSNCSCSLGIFNCDSHIKEVEKKLDRTQSIQQNMLEEIVIGLRKIDLLEPVPHGNSVPLSAGKDSD